MSSFGKKKRRDGRLPTHRVTDAPLRGIHNWFKLHLMQSLHGSASCPGTVWWTVIFSPAASSRQSPCAGLLVAVQWPGLPYCSIMSFIISSSKSGWYVSRISSYASFGLRQLSYTPWTPNNAEGRKIGCSNAPAWVNWNKKIMQIWSSQFSDAIQVPSQKS